MSKLELKAVEGDVYEDVPLTAVEWLRKLVAQIKELHPELDRCVDACADEDKRLFPIQPWVVLRRDLMLKGPCRCMVILRLFEEWEERWRREQESQQ